MKKILTVLLLLLGSFTLAGCEEDTPPTEPKDPVVELTDFEKVDEARTALDLGDISAITANMVLPQEGLHLVEISWESSDKFTINEKGIVNRPEVGEGDKVVTLTAELRFNANVDTKVFIVTVKELPSGDAAELAEAVEELIVTPDSTVFRDYVVLPRIASFATTITWESSNESVIALDGTVNRPGVGESDVEVTLTATVSHGDLQEVKAIVVTVIATSQEETYDTISPLDPRILREVYVEDETELIQAFLDIQEGDAIILKDGAYRDINQEIYASGSNEHPIFIMAENPGMATFEGGTTLRIYGDHWVLANLHFTNGYPIADKGAIIFEGNYNRLTNTRIFDFEYLGYDYKWVSLEGMYHEVDHNTFESKKTGGALLTIWRDDETPQFHHIHHNLFKDYQDTGGANGYETIRVGTSQQSQTDSYVLIENNRFENIDGEIEIISVKSGRTVVRDNTVINSKGMFTLRHGKNSVIINNVFLTKGKQDAGGVRAYDGGHIISNNYMEDINTSSNTRGGLVIHSGVNVPGTNTTLNAQWTSFNLLIENNTLYNCRQSILFGGKYTVPSYMPYLKNNFIVTSGWPVIRADKQPTDAMYEDNFFYGPTFSDGGSANFSSVPTGITYDSVLPTLTQNSEGLYLHDTYGAQNLHVMDMDEVGADFE